MIKIRITAANVKRTAEKMDRDGGVAYKRGAIPIV